MENIIYITIDMAIQTHKKTIENSGGGITQPLDLDRLDSVLSHIQNDDYYKTFAEKLSNLFFCTCQFHCFADGNKRLALSLSAQFLLLNGYLHIARNFFMNLEHISYHVASGKIKEDLLLEIMISILDETFEINEDLKLKIYNAINNDVN